MKIGLVVGSLRKESWNKKVAEVVKGLFPEDCEVDFIEIKNLPLYNQEFDEIPPESFVNLRKEVRGKDGFIFFTPEYNRSYAPAIKNALDVASRDPEGNPWAGKTAAVFSSSPGSMGGMAANLALRQVFVNLDLITMQQPEVYLANIDKAFEGGYVSERTNKLLQKAVNQFVQLTRKHI
ncbi:MAG: NAD(P)H-dependent oxidoreductase [Clostridiales bacterium]|nr:NAD(P)H-dependent oxidoreductase [Clostridiales bacterium]